jgi:hypothetical protein
MPSVKRGTAREDVDVGVREAKGLLDWREDRWGGVRVGECGFGVWDRSVGWVLIVVRCWSLVVVSI